MPDDQQEANCILGISCGKDGKQLQALTKWLQKRGLDHAQARHIGTELLQSWDFMPHGTTTALKAEIAEYARGNPYE